MNEYDYENQPDRADMVDTNGPWAAADFLLADELEDQRKARTVERLAADIATAIEKNSDHSPDALDATIEVLMEWGYRNPITHEYKEQHEPF